MSCFPSLILRKPRYCSFSISVSLSLSNKNKNLHASFPTICVRASKASSYNRPLTSFSEMNITGYFPICSAHSSLLFAIYNPSNKDSSVPISKKARSILILRVLPKRLGLVNRFTFPQFCKSCSISFVLSI